MRKAGRVRKIAIAACVVVVLGMTGAFLASCNSSKTTKQPKTQSGVKLPPGVTAADGSQSSATSSPMEASSPAASSSVTSTSSSAPATTTATPSASADLVGGRFTVVNASRPDTNKSVVSSSGREVPGDYLEVELTIFNTGAEEGLVDLSQYSFRLSSPGIAADTYSDYYGTTTTYGGYVSTHVISATLLDYSSLSAVTYKVKVGETISKVFVFFDLNPETDAPNAGVTKENTSLILRKVSGTDYGTQVSIPLAGYPD